MFPARKFPVISYLADRRSLLALAGLMPWAPGLLADELTKTPPFTEGPFYPDRLPLDTDNDLIIVNNALTPAVGTITHLAGRVLDLKGNPVPNAGVEIWQVDNGGAYLHSGTSNKDKKDKNFQGFGRFTTSSTGEYYFRTIQPVPYPGRTPHIHVKVRVKGKEIITTQFFVAEEKERNNRDGIYKSVRDPKALAMVTSSFTPIPNSKLGEKVAKFNIVLGLTPEMP